MADEIRDTLRRHFGGARPGDEARGEALGQEGGAMYDKKLRTAKILTVLYLVLSVAMIVGGGLMLFQSTDTKTAIIGAVIVLFGGQVQVLVKLWYWQVDTRVKLGRDLRELQLRLLAPEEE